MNQTLGRLHGPMSTMADSNFLSKTNNQIMVAGTDQKMLKKVLISGRFEQHKLKYLLLISNAWE